MPIYRMGHCTNFSLESPAPSNLLQVFSWCALVCISPYFIGTEIEGMAVLAHPDYEATRWQGTLLMWAVVLIPIIINVFARRVLSVIEVAAGVMHVVFLPVTIATFVILAPRNSNAFVWDTFVSGLSGWQNPGVVYSVGLLGVITPLSGISSLPLVLPLPTLTNPPQASTASSTCPKRSKTPKPSSPAP